MTVEAFIERWQHSTASERATAQAFIIDLCDLLQVPRPDHTADYMFERALKEAHASGETSDRYVDCYKRGHFILEAKKIRAGSHTRSYSHGLLGAHAQAQNYARALPAAEGRPPFILVVDVGNYIPFPDPRSHQIRLQDLRDDTLRERLRLIWTDPLALDASRASAKVTRQVADLLAAVAKSLEADGHPPHQVGAFLTRCLFCMFAEDVGLLPASGQSKGAFSELLQRHREDPAVLQRMLQALWADMDRGGFSVALTREVLRFDGKLFKGAQADGYCLPLTPPQIDGLLRAAQANWTEVEPAIFGTLLERALDPDERHSLGAHFTPRAYVERLVMPTVIDPLRAEWNNTQAAVLLLMQEHDELQTRADELTASLAQQQKSTLAPRAQAKDGLAAIDKYQASARARKREALQTVQAFHHRLCTVLVLVLDPACGSGNFLYVTLEHLKRLEGEVLNQLEALAGAQDSLDLAGETVTLQQLRGIELNPRAAALAELVLWIGYLQWQARTVGVSHIAEPVVHDYGNIDNRDAVLAAYGWADLGPVPWTDEAARAAWTDALLQRLVDLNTRRAAEEASGTIRWLRPEFQNPARATTAPTGEQTPIDLGSTEATDHAQATDAPPPGARAAPQQPWPATLPEQIKAVADVLGATSAALDLDAIATHFKGKGRWRERLPMILDTLVALGRVQVAGETWRRA